MISYFCSNCNVTTEYSVCPHCGKRTDIKSTAVFWCDECNIPIYDENCPICGSKGHKIGSDIRPVFPEERLLLEIILGVPFKYKNSSVWNTAGNHYIADGKAIPFTVRQTKALDIGKIQSDLEKYRLQNEYTAFESTIERFIEANKGRYNYIVTEATEYIRTMAQNYLPTEMYVSFSGGKDSTVTSSLVMKALGTEEILHIYGDTTLEFPETKEYVDRFKKRHNRTPLIVAKNKDKDFDALCEQLGPPSRVMRWCCTIFKTGAIQRKINSVFKNSARVLTFYGIRRNESVSRSKYERESDSPKITIQKTVSPIIDWFDFDIWLYMLTENIDFNNAYRLGYTRVGCWCCPNNSGWSEFMSKIYMPEQYEKFHSFLLSFAEKIGKPDPEVYVAEGKWKARQGGNGLEYAKSSVLTYEPCALMEDTLNFELQRPISDELYELFKPLGYINKEIGNKRLGEVFVTDKQGMLMLKLTGKTGSKTLKVSILDKGKGNNKSTKALEDKIKCQITKYQMCMGCLACESICMSNAVSIRTDKEGLISYSINDDKCIRCGHCINHFDGGCYMRKVMTIKRS